MKKSTTAPLKALVYCAMLAAISVVMARVLCFATPDGVRWSLDKFPLFLAGMFFGPVMGSLTGFVADFTGSLMQFGFNPLLCPPAILYGLCGGLLRWYLQKKTSWFRLLISYAHYKSILHKKQGFFPLQIGRMCKFFIKKGHILQNRDLHFCSNVV